MFRASSREDESRRRISVNRFGLAGPKGIMIRLRVPDPEHVTLFGAALTLIEQRAPNKWERSFQNASSGSRRRTTPRHTERWRTTKI